MPHPRHSSDEIAQRGQTLYDQQIKPQVEAGNTGKYVAIDIETGQYEIGDDHLSAVERALAKRSGAPLYVVRVGYPAAARIGGRFAASAQ